MAYLGNLPLSDGAAALELLFAQKSDIDHRHSISDVDGLADALAGGGGGGGDIPYATTSVAGKIRIATSTDTTSNDKAVTPASMANFVNNAINNIGDYNGVYGSGVYTIFKTPGVTTFNTPAGVTEARVTVIGPGGNGIDPTNGAVAAGGGGGGYAQGIYPVSGSYNVTVGTPGSSSSFGTLLSATSGENGASVNGNLVGGNGGNGVGGNLVNRRGGRGSGGPIAPAEYIDFTESLYSPGTTASKPWQQQYAFNDVQSTDITGWTTGTSLPGTLASSQAVVTKNRVYLFGGTTTSGTVSTVYTAPIDSDGTLGVWTTGTSLPRAMVNAQVVVTKDRVYLLGIGTYATYSAPINSDGTIGTWTEGTLLPISLVSSQAIVTKNRVYLLGGQTTGNAETASVITAPIDTNGIIGTWTAAGSIPVALSGSQAVVIKNRAYLLGGTGPSGGTNVYVSTINSDGTLGIWTASGTLPDAISYSQAVVTKNRIYLVSGVRADNSWDVNSVVYNAPIDSNGNIGTWSSGTALPVSLGYSQAVITKNRIHLLGGWRSGVALSTVYTAPFAGGLNDYTETYNSTPSLTGSGTIPSGVTTVTMIGKGGDAVASGSVYGSGKPWVQQYDFNDLQNTDITGWTTGTSLPVNLGYSQAVVTKNRVYLLGGVDGSGVSTVYTAPINTDGTLGTWTTGTSLPGALHHSQAVVTKNRVYLLSGISDSNIVSTVYTAPINTDGTLGTWTTGTSLPDALYHSQAVVTKNRVYLLGGVNGSIVSTVYTAPINTDGTIGTWTTGTSLPGNLGYSQAVVTKNRVYLLGGYNNNNAVSTVYTAPINTDGTLGTWTTGTSLPGALYHSQVTVTSGKIYLFGGADGTGSISTVYTAPINTDGTLGTWTTGTSLPGALHRSQAVVTKNRVYLLGGYNDNVVSTVYTASFAGGLNDYTDVVANGGDGTLLLTNATGSGTIPASANTIILTGKGGDAVASGSVYGSGKPWVQQYDFNDLQNTDITGWTTGTSLPDALYHSQAVVTKNRVYLLGGYKGGIAVSTVYTAPINTDGTIGTWAAGTSLPDALYYSQAVVIKNRVYLLGGVDGSGVSTVYTAPINTDGTIGTWAAGTSLPDALYYSQAVVTKNRVYLLGGVDGSTAVSTVYTAPINTDGTIGAWTTGASLPGALYYSQAVVIKNRVYLLGGYKGGTAVSTVYTAPINTDGTLGTWTIGASLPGALYYSQAVVTKNRVYLLGGYNGSGVSTVYTAPINTDGTIGAWTTGASLPGALYYSQAVVTKNRVYLLGGYNDSTAVSTVYTASFAGGLNDYTDVVANGGDGTLLLNGTASTITFNGTTYTFPGGSSLLPAVTTTFNVSLPGTAAAAYSYTKPTVGTELSITYSSSSIGAPTTITVNGVDYTFPGGVNGPAVQSVQNAYLTGNAAVNYSYNIAPGGLGAISYQVAGGGGGAGGSDSGGTGGGASGCYSEAFMRDAYGNNGGGFGNGMDTSVTTSGVTSVAHNFSGGGGNNSSTGGGKGGIGGGGGGGAIGGNGLVIVEW